MLLLPRFFFALLLFNFRLELYIYIKNELFKWNECYLSRMYLKSNAGESGIASLNFQNEDAD